ncbi:MAG: hypothetical protein DMG11_16230 [Acidobacteria bacterium]|nr:MAG: hypothetical protein DMG11_16230 [Acidobacteriota bacterium]
MNGLSRRNWIVLLALFVWFCSRTMVAVAQTANVVPVPRATLVPATADSFPFLAANRVQEVVDLAKLGYVEEEFVISGTANVYNWGTDGNLTVKTANAPYTTRILVRRPANAAKFSGNVIVEPLENTRRFDWAFLWAISHDYFTEHGDAWVGVTHNPQAIEALKTFNARRYASLSLANPNPSETCGPQNARSDSEPGLKFDILSQVAALFKSNSSSGPMPGFNVQNVYGTSHTGEIVTYIHAIHSHAQLANGKPAFDGYLIKGDSSPIPVSRCAPALPPNDPRRITRNVSVPVIRAVAEGDVLSAFPLRREDSDQSNDRYRLYEVAAAPHMDVQYYRHMPSTEDQAKAGQPAFPGIWPFAYQCDRPIGGLLELPVFQYTLNNAFANLDQWVRKGTAPPRAERMTVKDGGTPQATITTDQYGNGMGGVRSPYVDVPTATYVPHTPGQAICRNLGYKVPFDWVRLEKMYGSSRNYASKVRQSVDRVLKERWITESDAQRIKAELIAPARTTSNNN